MYPIAVKFLIIIGILLLFIFLPRKLFPSPHSPNKHSKVTTFSFNCNLFVSGRNSQIKTRFEAKLRKDIIFYLSVLWRWRSPNCLWRKLRISFWEKFFGFRWLIPWRAIQESLTWNWRQPKFWVRVRRWSFPGIWWKGCWSIGYLGTSPVWSLLLRI